MGYFKWFGYDGDHKPHTGFIACSGADEVALLLQQQAIQCVHVYQVGYTLFSPCTFAERQVVLHELSQLLQAQVRLSQALKIISSLVKKEYVRQVLLDCMRGVDQGKSFPLVAQRYPELFDLLTVHALKAGHDSGFLAQACTERSKQLTQIADIRAKIVAASVMPLITGLFFVVIVIFLMIVILPQFKRIFTLLKTPLPHITQFLLHIGDFFTVSHLSIMGLFLIVGTALFYAFCRTSYGKALYDNLLIYTPGIGGIYQDLVRAQVLQALSLLVGSGQALAYALANTAESFDNLVVRNQLLDVQKRLQSGKPFDEAIVTSPLLAIPEIKNCLTIAYQTAQLEIILQQLSLIFRSRALKTLDRMTLVIQPLLLIGLGLAIATVLLALYLPLLLIPQII